MNVHAPRRVINKEDYSVDHERQRHLKSLLSAKDEAERRHRNGEAPGVRYTDLTREERLALFMRKG